MRRNEVVIHIARWELRRWFKWKDQFNTLLISVAIGVAVWGGKALLEKGQQKKVKISVINPERISLAVPPESRLVLSAADARDEGALRDAVGRRQIEGLLILKSPDDAELVVYAEPLWKSELEHLLTEARREAKIRGMDVPPGRLADAFRAFRIDVVFHEAGRAPTSTAEKIAAGIAIGLMLFGVFLSAAQQFVAITGEKQLRVTEQVISAVSPQQWMDGKIIGVSAYAFLSVVVYVVGISIFFAVSRFFGTGPKIPFEITDPLILFFIALLAIGGFFFWNTFFAAVAATIDDPNTSTRSPLMFLPFLATIGVAFFVFKNPDSILMKTLSILPVTSSAVLSARLVLTEVAAWEILSALPLLGLSIWAMRRAAGKIFHTGILLYGKEPTLREMLRWTRESAR